MTRRMRYPKFPPARRSADWVTCGSSAGIASCAEQLVAAPRGGAGTTGEVAISPHEVVLVISQPSHAGLNPDLKLFWDNETWRNRLIFLCGSETFTRYRAPRPI